jgi:hypothetical protein
MKQVLELSGFGTRQLPAVSTLQRTTTHLRVCCTMSLTCIISTQVTVILEMTVLWCCAVQCGINRRFGCAYCLHHQGDRQPTRCNITFTFVAVKTSNLTPVFQHSSPFWEMLFTAVKFCSWTFWPHLFITYMFKIKLNKNGNVYFLDSTKLPQAIVMSHHGR